jgi:hypothetical protein
MIGKVAATLASMLMVSSLFAADDAEPRRCNYAGKIYGVGKILYLNDKVFRCSTVYGETVQPLYYWVRVLEQEERLREEQQKARGQGKVTETTTQ